MKRMLLQVVLVVMCLMLTAGAAYAEEKPLIGFGDYNEDVINLHQKLSELGLYDLRAESPWSTQSSEAVRMLQRYLNMDATGIVANQGELDQILTIDFVDRTALALAQIEENLFVNVEYSAGASSNDKGGYTFVTDVEGNVFNGVNMQLCTVDGTYIETCASHGVGFQEGNYTFSHESGEYRIRLKANSNKQDEMVTAIVSLEQGTTYHYVYSVGALEAQHVDVIDVAFGKKK